MTADVEHAGCSEEPRDPMYKMVTHSALLIASLAQNLRLKKKKLTAEAEGALAREPQARQLANKHTRVEYRLQSQPYGNAAVHTETPQGRHMGRHNHGHNTSGYSCDARFRIRAPSFLFLLPPLPRRACASSLPSSRRVRSSSRARRCPRPGPWPRGSPPAPAPSLVEEQPPRPRGSPHP